jgi:hypothetical protein
MSVKVNFNEKRFNRIMDTYLKYSGRSFTNEVNKRAFNVSLKAVGKTKKVWPSKIRREMLKGSKINPKAPVAAIMVNYFRGRMSKKGLWGQPMSKSVARAVEFRMRGSGFYASCFLGAATAIGPYVKPPRTVRSGRLTKTQIGKPKGIGRPEKRIGALKPVARGTNTAPNSAENKAAKNGLKLALNAETRDMLKYLRRKIPKDISTLDRNNAAQAIAARKL